MWTVIDELTGEKKTFEEQYDAEMEASIRLAIHPNAVILCRNNIYTIKEKHSDE